MKLIIAGGRGRNLTQSEYELLDKIHSETPITEVVSGAATGVDKCGEFWAKQNKITVRRFPAEWHKYGPSAGPRRNKAMAAYAHAVALFPGGRGTDSMWREAKEAGLVIFDWRNGND
jgi:hypothetical protein